MKSAASTHWADDVVQQSAARSERGAHLAAEARAAEAKRRMVAQRDGPAFLAALRAEFEVIAASVTTLGLVVRGTGVTSLVLAVADLSARSVAVFAVLAGDAHVQVVTRGHATNGGQRHFLFVLDGEDLRVRVDGALLTAAGAARTFTERWLSDLLLSDGSA